jgi:hypothetical protein
MMNQTLNNFNNDKDSYFERDERYTESNYEDDLERNIERDQQFIQTNIQHKRDRIGT